ncbi:helix-turn-helix transcriptional regulator [Oceanobacillus salinisoli]|uniref:helix-turn-helix transcriptional regulator n=1 Tax=Oceanobacillus salinisoli TaxID=2678611 RepID=UPI0012E162F6|nr:helix-turn-helix transcriptional regulator [Oceanobacillus salinisoli]
MAYKVGRCLLRYRLKEAGMTQRELAEKLGVSEPQINKYVNNRQGMSYQVAYNIAIILGCRMEDLYEWFK